MTMGLQETILGAPRSLDLEFKLPVVGVFVTFWWLLMLSKWTMRNHNICEIIRILTKTVHCAKLLLTVDDLLQQ